jgi:hypothetical protein
VKPAPAACNDQSQIILNAGTAARRVLGYCQIRPRD